MVISLKYKAIALKNVFRKKHAFMLQIIFMYYFYLFSNFVIEKASKFIHLRCTNSMSAHKGWVLFFVGFWIADVFGTSEK